MIPRLQLPHADPREKPALRALLNLRPPRATLLRWLAVTALLLAFGALHHLSGRNIGLYTFFVLPCVLAGWSIGRAAGLVTAMLSAAIALASDLNTHADLSLAQSGADAFLRACVYALVAWGADAIGGLQQRLEALSRTDALTGLANRRAFLIRGDEEIRRAGRSKRPFSILFIDLDNFKLVNDASGHAAGDALLSRVGRLMAEQVRAVDTSARLGGDEFAVLLPETEGVGALSIARKLHQALKSEFAATGLAVSSSIGAATFLQPPAAFGEALKCADELMYSIKKGAKDAVIQRDFPAAGAEISFPGAPAAY